MKRPAAVTRFAVPYLPEKVIEEHAQLVLDEWAVTHGAVTEPPVPIDDLIELHLGLTFEIEDLQALFSHPDVLGAIWFSDQIVRVDRSLDPHEHPHLRGRYHFTLAHEAGHWRLHRTHYREDPSQAKLFDGRGQPTFVCRSSQKPPEEWQADYFAGCLLMPRQLLRTSWEQWRGTLDPVAADDLPRGQFPGGSATDANTAMEVFCKPLAERFQVSPEAMRIRLQKLEFLVNKRPNNLF